MLQWKPQNKQGITSVCLVWPLKQIKVTEKYKQHQVGAYRGDGGSAANANSPGGPGLRACMLIITVNIGEALYKRSIFLGFGQKKKYCPAQPTLFPQTQRINKDDPCWWCKRHATRGRKDHTITLCAFRSREGNHTNKCSQVRKKLKILIVLLLYLDRPEQTSDHKHMTTIGVINKTVDWWTKPEDGHFNQWVESLSRNHHY